MPVRGALDPEEFLRELTKTFPDDACVWLCSSRKADDPDFTGRVHSLDALPDFDSKRNWWYSTAAFPSDAKSRAIAAMLGVAVIVVDDPTSKGDAGKLIASLGRPSFKVRTSEGSQQWGYLLKEPATRVQVAPVLAKIHTLKLGDRSGNNAVRYARLPCGVNNKSEYGEAFKVHLVSWKPKRRFTIEDIAQALSVTEAHGSDGSGAMVERVDDDELKRLILSGDSYHGPMTQLTARAICSGESYGDAKKRLEALMLESEGRDNPKRRDSWQQTFDDIGRMLRSAQEKYPVASIRSRLRRDERKSIIADEENVRLILENDPTLQGLIRYDDFSMRRVLTRPVPGDASVVASDDYPRQWRDEDMVAFQQYVQRSFAPRISRDKVDGALGVWARNYWAFHPIREYLKSLEWDGHPRLDQWLSTYMGAAGAPDEYLEAVGAKWMISAIARVMEPGCQADYAIVLEGAQGKKKSTALRVLAGTEYFSDSLPNDLSTKDAHDHVRGKWIIELPELAQFRRSVIETVKAFITRRVERFRPAYGRNEIEYPRQCVFAGTTNESEYLIDDTGNRRFWPVHCEGRVTLKALRRDRDLLWAEAYRRYAKGERWYLDEQTEALAAKQTEKRRLVDPWHDAIGSMLKSELLGPRDRVRPGEILEQLNIPAAQRTSFHAGRVGKILKSFGWRKRSRFYVRPD
jgi:predicted P-loop ATPase